ncbi:MAG: hypothetical protein HOE82_14930 [Gammaproteobacteria bacterium]|jgi:hypothetical protein|nr:hypothetical protein [Gammaproteobacteria bacterium]
MSLDATIGGASSDSYITVAASDTYHSNHLYATAWTGASTDDKEKALKMATRILDERLSWIGDKHTEAQALRWPRSSVRDKDGYSVATTEIPTDITNATAEFARHLISSDLTAASEGKGIGAIKADKINVKFNAGDRLDVLPEIVREMIGYWGALSTGRGGIGVARVIR